MSQDSPYRISDTYRLEYEDGEYSLERTDISSILQNSTLNHVVLEGETLQSISFKYYGDSGRWGDIASYNGIIDPFDIEEGMTLLIPN